LAKQKTEFAKHTIAQALVNKGGRDKKLICALHFTIWYSPRI